MNTYSFLATLPLFDDLPAQLLQDIVTSIVKRSFASGEVIVKQGDRAEECFIVLSGGAIVSYEVAPAIGKTAVIATLSSGDLFGEIALLDNSARAADVIATEPTECLVIRKENIRRLADNNHTFALRLLTLVVTRLSEMEKQASTH